MVAPSVLPYAALLLAHVIVERWIPRLDLAGAVD